MTAALRAAQAGAAESERMNPVVRSAAKPSSRLSAGRLRKWLHEQTSP